MIQTFHLLGKWNRKYCCSVVIFAGGSGALETSDPVELLNHVMILRIFGSSIPEVHPKQKARSI
ncbi:hypothetical protein O9993_20410 [Vibrio lentus]|nr:hypothetical protein [Vibrio lentus]